jgi:hypothetical protein
MQGHTDLVFGLKVVHDPAAAPSLTLTPTPVQTTTTPVLFSASVDETIICWNTKVYFVVY